MSKINVCNTRLSLLAAALCAAFGPARAEEPDLMTRLTRPESSVSAGIGVVDDNNRYFGEYSGKNDSGAHGLLDLDLVKRDDATGTWFKLTGRNLGLDSRELRFSHERQGDWAYFIEYNQIPRYQPLVTSSAVSGIGSSSLQLPSPYPSAGSDVQLETERDILTLGFDKILPAGFDLKLRFRNEEKEGTRLFARGTTTYSGTFRGAFEFTPEPIDSTTQIAEVTVGYTSENLQLSGGYHGSFYKNHNTALTVAGSPAMPNEANWLASFSPIALPPGNEAHELFLTGGYSFTRTARLNFKVSHSRGTQDEQFIVPAAASVGRNNLDGEVDVTKAQLGFTAKPLPKLSVLANLRYEDRDDKTPIANYFTTTGAWATTNGDNEPRSVKTTAGKLEATYQLPLAFRLTGGVEYEEKKRNTSPVRVVSFREKTDETSYRLELRRSISETANGALSYLHANRGGSDWYHNFLQCGADSCGGAPPPYTPYSSNLTHPLHLADRDRDRWRLSVDWTPVERLSLTFTLEDTNDDYSGRTYGLRKIKSNLYSIDASYKLSDEWQLNGWVSRTDGESEQRACANASYSAPSVCPNNATFPIWDARLTNLGDAYGLGLRGEVTSKIKIGADFQFSYDRSETDQRSITAGSVAALPLPDTYYKMNRLSAFGTYAIRQNAGLRIDLAYERRRLDDWTWSSFNYSDGSKVFVNPSEEVTFIGVSGYMKWF